MIPRYPVYLFDIDGTLLDSAADICGAIQTVLASTPRNNVPDSVLRAYIGRHLLDLFRDLFPENSDAQHDELIRHYRAVYPERGHRMTRPYPGVKQMLGALGGRKSTATTKGTPTTRAVLEMFELLAHFDHVQGTDGFPAKPSPDVILRSVELFGVSPADCLLVGDSSADMEAGRRAGVRTCAVTWGYGNRAEMARWEPDHWIDEPRGLLNGAPL